MSVSLIKTARCHVIGCGGIANDMNLLFVYLFIYFLIVRTFLASRPALNIRCLMPETLFYDSFVLKVRPKPLVNLFESIHGKGVHEGCCKAK